MKIAKSCKYMATLLSLMLVLVPSCRAEMNGVVHDNYTIDIFKTDKISAQEIDKRYRKQLNEIATKMLASKQMPTEETGKSLNNAFNTILSGIMERGEFAYISMSPIVYPGKKYIGISIDVVDKTDKVRLEGMLPKPTKSYPDPAGLLASWNSYEAYGFTHYFSTGKRILMKDCPAFHCLFGFDEPALKKFGVIFNTEVPKHKSELITILRNDKDDSKRAAAAYLLAHIKDGDELVKILAPSMRDSSSNVRNNVMRVLLEALMIIKDPVFSVSEAVHALNFPATTDRNKDLYVLASLSAKPRYTKYIKEHACHAVMEQYRLVQPNLHSGAYEVLLNISGEKYGLDDVASWEAWTEKNCPAPDKV